MSKLSVHIAFVLLAATTPMLAGANPPLLNAAGTEGPLEPSPSADLALPPGVLPPTGNMLIYLRNSRAPFPFSNLAAATGLAEVRSSTLPADLATYACVVLPVTQSFTSAELTALTTYVQGGGNLLAIGEWSAFHGTSNGAMNALAQSVGSQLRIQTGAKDLGYHDTTDIPLTTMTLGVATFRYAAYSPIINTDPILAPGLALGTDGTAILAAQQAGLGVFTLMADINAFSDFNGGAFANADNDVLGNHVCNGLVALGLPLP